MIIYKEKHKKAPSYFFYFTDIEKVFIISTISSEAVNKSDFERSMSNLLLKKNVDINKVDSYVIHNVFRYIFK